MWSYLRISTEMSDLLFGVNDLTQVANEDFCRDENFQDLIIKPKGM